EAKSTAFMQLVPRESLPASMNRTFAQASLGGLPSGERFRALTCYWLDSHAHPRFVRQIDGRIQMDRVSDDYPSCGFRHMVPPGFARSLTVLHSVHGGSLSNLIHPHPKRFI